MDKSWTTRSAEPEEFGPGDSVGIQGGTLSDGGEPGRQLVGIDIDDMVALTKADEYLPPTGAVEGRHGKPRSHRWYFITGPIPSWAASNAAAAVAAATAAGREPGLATRHFRHADTGQGLFDVIATGGQAVAPPSLHPSGERRLWHDGGGISQAAVVTFEELSAAVQTFGRAVGANMPDRAEATEEAEAGEVERPAVPQRARVEGTRLPECDVAMGERAERCGRYLAEVDLARSGHGGHGATYRVAKLIVNDFAVTDRDTAVLLLRTFNERLRGAGEEAWSEGEMGHKIDDALKSSPKSPFPFGCKLSGPSPDRAVDPPRAWNDPARLAGGFLGDRLVRFVKKTAFEYLGGVYQVVSGEHLSAAVRTFVQGEADAEGRRRAGERQTRLAELKAELTKPLADGESDESLIGRRKAARAELAKLDRDKPVVAPAVTRELVRNALDAVAACGQLPDATELDAWLGDRTDGPVIAVANGLLDPVTRTLGSFEPDWFATAQLPVGYEPDAPSPARWLAFLNEVMEGDAERIAVLQEVFGACLDRAYPAKFFAALVGSGDNGKSVCLAVLRFLLGGANCSAVNLDELSNQRFASFQMFGKLANIVGDQGHFESADEGRLKAITGGDLVTYEQKGRDSFVAVNRAKLIFACNAMPSFSDKSEAVWNRMMAVPFRYTVPVHNKNPALLTAEYWASELPGILNWALEGLARLRSQRRFTGATWCEWQKGQARVDSNPARQFLLENAEFTGRDENSMPVNELYQVYRTWAVENGVKHLLIKARFGREVRAVFTELEESRTVRQADGGKLQRIWAGLKLKSEDGAGAVNAV